MIRDSDHPPNSISLIVTEAILLHDALDEFLDCELTEEDGPVVDFCFRSADVDAQRWFREGKGESQRG